MPDHVHVAPLQQRHVGCPQQAVKAADGQPAPFLVAPGGGHAGSSQDHVPLHGETMVAGLRMPPAGKPLPQRAKVLQDTGPQAALGKQAVRRVQQRRDELAGLWRRQAALLKHLIQILHGLRKEEAMVLGQGCDPIAAEAEPDPYLKFVKGTVVGRQSRRCERAGARVQAAARRCRNRPNAGWSRVRSLSDAAAAKPVACVVSGDVRDRGHQLPAERLRVLGG